MKMRLRERSRNCHRYIGARKRSKERIKITIKTKVYSELSNELLEVHKSLYGLLYSSASLTCLEKLKIAIITMSFISDAVFLKAL